MLTIIDYGAGNLFNVQKAFEYLGATPHITQDPADIATATQLVLPGVGAFGAGMNTLVRLGLADPIRDYIRASNPFLGICVGFQFLFEGSDESPGVQGLGIFKGHVRQFSADTLTVPHMGWNTLNVQSDSGHYYDSVDRTDSVYFVHSFYVDTPETQIVSTTTPYGHAFVSSIQTDQLLATQFHPEKSGPVGLSILRQFLNRFHT